MKLKSVYLGITALAFVVGMASCSHEPIIPEFPALSFSKDVQPIIVGSCTQSGCHDGGSGNEAFSLLTYTDVARHVKGKDAKNSKIYLSITGSGEDIMPRPPQAPLSDESIKTIYLWIIQGAKNN
ncbi:MAG: hypothetical protein NTX03_04695 [Bacteroidetes bacterium]|nr:hypothetical protein [Bacteroidota bacterium]